MSNTIMKVGIISDTHGVIRENTLDAFSGVRHIIHAGDVGGQDVIQTLEQVAPVTAVRGNTDGGQWANSLLTTQIVQLGGYTFYVLHDLATLDLDPASVGIQVVVSGHTHQSSAKTNNGVLYLNPGSASYRRRGNPLSIAILTIAHNSLAHRIVVLP
jgi:putative phosphoesterase